MLGKAQGRGSTCRMRSLCEAPRQRLAEELSWKVSEQRRSRMETGLSSWSVCCGASEITQGHIPNEHGRRRMRRDK